MYFIDKFGDICYKSSIDRVYFFVNEGGHLDWVFFADWIEFSEEDRKRFISGQISDKYRALHNIPNFSLDF